MRGGTFDLGTKDVEKLEAQSCAFNRHDLARLPNPPISTSDFLTPP
jgi:hypothetical protein